jgi:hypothetical protein
MIVMDLDLAKAKVKRSYVAPTIAMPAGWQKIEEPISAAGGASGKAILRRGKLIVALHAIPAGALTENAPRLEVVREDAVAIRESRATIPMMRLAQVLHRGEDRTFEKDDVLGGFVVDVFAGEGAESERFLKETREASVLVKDYGTRKAVEFRRGQVRLGIERDFAANETLGRWTGDRHYAPRLFHSEYFELDSRGLLQFKVQ